MTDSAHSYILFDTQIGVCGVAWSDHGLTRLQLPEADPEATERRLRSRAREVILGTPPAAVARMIGALRAYARGETIDFASAELDLAHAPALHAKVYAAAREIGWGQTTTYGAIAKQIGEPEAAQAVGQALGRNPIPIIVPCHRVLAAGGKSGGFSAYGGVTSKMRLLALEGVHLGPEPSIQQSFAFTQQSRRHR